MHFPISAQPTVNAPAPMPTVPVVQHNAPIQMQVDVAAAHVQQFGCVGCPGAGDAHFGADPSLTASTWPAWVKVLIAVGVISLGLVVYHHVSK